MTIELYKRAVKKAKCVFFQNDSDRTFFDSNHIVYPKGITLPGSGVNLKKFVPLPYPGKEEPIRFIYVARVMKAKGIEQFFEAAHEIKKHYPNDSGGLVICKDKNKLDKKEASRKINKSLKTNFYWVGREWPYKNVKPRIIAEKYMTSQNEEWVRVSN